MLNWLSSLSSGWFGSVFANPAFILPAALLISIPIIIHFINRMRYRRVKWAAMEFLLASQKKNRRRLMLEQLLLLLLRILAVAAIIALVARPLLDASQMALLQGQKTNHVVLLDDTASMQQKRGGDSSVFAAAKDVVRKIVAEGVRRPGTQTLTLVRLTEPDKPEFTVRNLDKGFAEEFERRIDSLKASHRAADWAAAIKATVPLMESQKGSLLNLHVVSDFRSQDWTDTQAIQQSLQAVRDAGSNVNFVRASPQGGENLGVTDLGGNVEVAAANVPLRLRVTVRNYGDQIRKGVNLSVFADGQKLPVTVPFQTLEPGRDVAREFDVVFATPGDHVVRVSLPPDDALVADDDRYLAIRVPDVNPVLIIANESADVVQDLQDALAPSPGLTGFAPQVQGPEFLRRNSLDRFQAVFLVDIAQLHPDAVRTLETFVEAGGGICWYLGPRVNGAYYNDKLYRSGFGIGPEEKTPAETFHKRDLNEDGKLTKPEFIGTATAAVQRDLTEAFSRLDRNQDNSLTPAEFAAPRNGLFPLKLGSIATLSADSNDPPAPDIEFTDHPMFSVFTTGEDNPFVNTVKVTQYFAPVKEWKPDDGVRVTATLRNRAPLFVEHRYGKGTVTTCLTSCRDWSNWATVPPAFVVLQLETVKHISRARHALEKRIVGEPIRSRVDPAVYKTQVTIVRPDGTQESRDAAPESAPPPQAGTAAAAGNRGTPAATMYVDEFRGTDAPGVYGLLRRPLAGGEESEKFAYNVPSSESRLDVLGTEGLRKSLGASVPVTIQEFDVFNWIAGKQSETELHDLVMYALLAILVFEQMMAFRLSFHKR